MALTKFVKTKGGTMWLEVHAEVLFAQGQMVDGWTRRFAERTKRYTSAAAPRHNYAKRPLRPHGGPHLKTTFIVGKSKSVLNPMGGVVLSAMGSTSPYALFVDQGTSGQMAKILPPWAPGSPTLFESTHVNSMGGAPGPKPVSGQTGQHFFDAGLASTMKYMLNRSFQKLPERGMLVPGSGGISNLGWSTFFGNSAGSDATFWNPGGSGRLNEWRRWRDEAWIPSAVTAEGRKNAILKGKGKMTPAREKLINQISNPNVREREKEDAQQSVVKMLDEAHAMNESPEQKAKNLEKGRAEETEAAAVRQERRRIADARTAANAWVSRGRLKGTLTGNISVIAYTHNGVKGYLVKARRLGKDTPIRFFDGKDTKP